MPIAEDVDLKHVSELTDNFTGADLAGLCRQVPIKKRMAE
jgi:SpoVK/Ycf46/Vps4 family AAA+-type ATPase